MFDRHEILKQRYTEEIGRWDWDTLAEEVVQQEAYEGTRRLLLGTVFAIMPSGKFYAPWTTNQTRSDITRDTAFFEALTEVAGEMGGWIESSDDLCDIFFCVAVDGEEPGNE